MENINDKNQAPKNSSLKSDPDIENSAASTNNSAGETSQGPFGSRRGGTDLSGVESLGVPSGPRRNENDENAAGWEETNRSMNDDYSTDPK